MTGESTNSGHPDWHHRQEEKRLERQAEKLTRKLHDAEAEISVIGALMLNREVVTEVQAQGLLKDDFTAGPNRALFEAAMTLIGWGQEADIVQMKRVLEDTNQLDKVGGVQRLSSILEVVPAASNVGHYAKIVKELSRRRQLLVTLKEAERQAVSGEFGSVPLAKRISSDLCTFALQGRRGELRPMCEIGAEWVHQLEQDSAPDGPTAKPVPTGFIDLDHLLGRGMRPGALMLLAARPGEGKTTLALNIADNAARQHRRVAFFSLEMSETEIYGKGICARTSADLHRLHLGTINASERSAIAAAIQDLSGLPMLVDDTGSITASEIAAKCRREKQGRDGLDLVIVDYLQLISTPRRRNSTRNEEVGEVSRALKLLAKELEVPVLALSQLNRLGETEEPKLSHLRDSGSLEQDADAVLFLARKASEPSVVFVTLAKHRLGPTGTVPLVFRRECQRFENQAPEADAHAEKQKEIG